MPIIDRIAKASGEGSGRASPPRAATSSGGRYTTEDWAHIARSTIVSVLDFCDCNPWSRLAASEFRSLEGVRSWSTQYVLQSQGFRDNAKIHEQSEESLGKLKLKLSGSSATKTSKRKGKTKR